MEGLRAAPFKAREKRVTTARPMVVGMRDWVADWNKWSRAERVLALLVTLILLALPLSLLITAKTGV